jgi:hypothetical protein
MRILIAQNSAQDKAAGHAAHKMLDFRHQWSIMRNIPEVICEVQLSTANRTAVKIKEFTRWHER